jgi:hypothetical protein
MSRWGRHAQARNTRRSARTISQHNESTTDTNNKKLRKTCLAGELAGHGRDWFNT